MKIYRDKLGTYRTNLAAAGGVHTSPELIRMEVAITKTDFNMRLKQVLFNCILSAYYAGFIPAAFSPRFVTFKNIISDEKIILQMKNILSNK